MKILIIGYGSIGKRYFSILNKKHKTYVYDENDEYKNLNFFFDIKNKKNFKFSRIIICTPPDKHLIYCKKFYHLKVPILVEKPLTNKFKEISEYKKYLSNSYVVSNMRFHIGFQNFEKNLVNLGDIDYMKFHFSHNLKKMGRNSFKNLNYEILYDCYHEFDMAFKYIKDYKIKSVNYIHNKGLAIFKIIFVKGTKIIEIHLDYLSETKNRGAYMLGSKGIFSWISFGKNPERIIISKHNRHSKKTYELNQKYNLNTMYDKMLNSFLSKNISLPKAKDSIKIIRLIDNIIKLLNEKK